MVKTHQKPNGALVAVSYVLHALSVPAERPVINKERLGGYYRLSAYVLAKNLSELVILIIPLVFFTVAFWLSGINYNFLVFLQLMGILLLTTVLAQVSFLLYS